MNIKQTMALVAVLLAGGSASRWSDASHEGRVELRTAAAAESHLVGPRRRRTPKWQPPTPRSRSDIRRLYSPQLVSSRGSTWAMGDPVR